MPTVITAENTIALVAMFAMLAVKIYALVSSLLFTPEHYRAADKLTKPTWVAILGLGVAANVLIPGLLGLLNLAFTIAALVFLVDVRPALNALTRR